MQHVVLRVSLLGCILAFGGCEKHGSETSARADSTAQEREDEAIVDTATPLIKMRDAMARQDWVGAMRFTQGTLIAHPSDPDVLTDVAKVTAKSGDKATAAKLLVNAAEASQYKPRSRVEFAVAGLVDVGEVYAAIDFMQTYLDVVPGDHKTRRNLIGFLGEAERYDLIPQHLQKLIVARQFDAPLLIVTTETSYRRFSRTTADRIRERNPNDRRFELSSARQLIQDSAFEQAAILLREIVDRHPDFSPAYAMLGHAMILSGADDKPLLQWLEDAPSGVDRFADYWLTLGDLAVRSDAPLESAVRAYWEATQCDPNNTIAWARLVQRIRLANRTSETPVLSDDAVASLQAHLDHQLEMRRRFYEFAGSGRKSQSEACRVAESLMALGRYWEAEAWSAIAVGLPDAPYADAKSLRERILKRLRDNPEWIASSGNPAMELDLDDLPLPEFGKRALRNNTSRFVIPHVAGSDHIRFSDQALDWGLAGVGGGNNPLGVRLTVPRTTGVGAGAVDYDLDGDSDLVVMGAGGNLRQFDSIASSLYRNTSEQFELVSQQSRVNDKSFGQGVCVGDYNEDGFPDLLLLNFGANRLYRNNGDGTYQDRTEDLGSNSADHWSTSAAFFDATGDGITDLFVTNYCQIPESLGVDDKEMGTHPLDYVSQEDVFLRSSGDGRLEDLSQAIRDSGVFGRGLGVIAGQLSDGQIGVFVANDMRANNLYTFPVQQEEIGSGKMPWPGDSAVSCGLAVDAQTQVQGSMGIANSDIDGDGDLDIYVTGFAREYSILYSQMAGGLWEDRTLQAKLVEPTENLVAFGTDALDLDCDGLDELVITNGDIGQLAVHKKLGIPYAQPLQIFRRDSDGVFRWIDDDHWGEYFRTSHVGRTLVNADFNRDGMSDVVITHNYEPVALLINQTRTQNHRIGFQLVGTRASRDAIGAVVRFRVAERKRTLWSVSGDGYMCSNERILRAGLGDATEIHDVVVTWRDGSVESFGNMLADAIHLLVQGQGDAFQVASFK